MSIRPMTLCIAGVGLTGAGITMQSALADPITYACDSVVLIGRVAHQSFTHISDPNDIVGHGRIDFDVNVHRVIRGRESRETIPARAIAHTYARENVDFLFVLKVAADGRYDVISGQVRSPGEAQPQLAPDCTVSER